MGPSTEQTICTDTDTALGITALAQYLPLKSAGEYFTRGGARYAAGRYDDALADFDKVIELEPDNETAQLMRDLIARQL